MRFPAVYIPVLIFATVFLNAQDAPAAPALEPGFAWPVEKDKKFQISSTFGESRIDHFHNGVDLPGEGFKVLSPKDARVLYRIHAFEAAGDVTPDATTPGEMPFGGGNTLVLDHGADGWSGFMHLKSFSESLSADAPVARGEKIGVSGNTGHSGGPHLHFFIYQSALRQMLNPLLFMDHTAYADTRPPEIKEWGVLLPEKLANINPEKSIRLTADYPVFIFLQDHGIGRERWGVFEYRVLLDDKEAINAKFDKILFKNDAWALPSGHKFEDIFYRNLYTLTPQVRHAKKVAVEAKDIKGNTFSKTYELKIQQN